MKAHLEFNLTWPQIEAVQSTFEAARQDVREGYGGSPVLVRALFALVQGFNGHRNLRKRRVPFEVLLSPEECVALYEQTTYLVGVLRYEDTQLRAFYAITDAIHRAASEYRLRLRRRAKGKTCSRPLSLRSFEA